jgi:hypothetical protein
MYLSPDETGERTDGSHEGEYPGTSGKTRSISRG